MLARCRVSRVVAASLCEVCMGSADAHCRFTPHMAANEKCRLQRLGRASFRKIECSRACQARGDVRVTRWLTAGCECASHTSLDTAATSFLEAHESVFFKNRSVSLASPHTNLNATRRSCLTGKSCRAHFNLARQRSGEMRADDSIQARGGLGGLWQLMRERAERARPQVRVSHGRAWAASVGKATLAAQTQSIEAFQIVPAHRLLQGYGKNANSPLPLPAL
jgi:hypothetical protein